MTQGYVFQCVYYLNFTLDIDILIFPLATIIVDIYNIYIFISLYISYIKILYIEYIHIMYSLYNILTMNKSMELFTWPPPDPQLVGRRSLEIGTWVLSYTQKLFGITSVHQLCKLGLQSVLVGANLHHLGGYYIFDIYTDVYISNI